MATDYYVVETILDKKLFGKNVKYYGNLQKSVKWQGYDMSDCTWEPIQNLKNVMNLVEEFDNKLNKKIKQESASSESLKSVESQKSSLEKTKLIKKHRQAKKNRNITQIQIKGSFEYGDKPQEIQDFRVLDDGQILFDIEWQPRENGEWPQNSFYTNHELRKLDAQFLLNFYEQKICYNFIKTSEKK